MSEYGVQDFLIHITTLTQNLDSDKGMFLGCRMSFVIEVMQESADRPAFSLIGLHPGSRRSHARGDTFHVVPQGIRLNPLSHQISSRLDIHQASLHRGPEGLAARPVTIMIMSSVKHLGLLIALLGVLLMTSCDREGVSSQASTVDPIKVGILHSKTGPLAISEKAVIDATILAIEDVNDQGGVLGRPLEPIVVDGSSNENTFAREAADLLDHEGVSVIFGCWTSASRKAVRPVIESRDGLLFYPVQYEGLEQSPNIIYLGSAPNQQILPAVDWAMDELGAKRFLMVGSDYVFPRAANAIITDHIKARGGEAIGEYYITLGSRDTTEMIAAIKANPPDVILNTINGDANISFFKGLREAGIQASDVPTISFSIGEPELRSMSSSLVAGDYAAWNYFQSIPGQDNLGFVRKFGQRYHPRRVLSDPMQSAWNAVHLWAKAAEVAGSIEPAMVRRSLSSIEYQAPEGLVRIDPDTQHLWMKTRIGQITPARFFDIVWESNDSMRPVPYPSSRSREDWDRFLQDLYAGWGERWSRPETP